MMYTAECIEIDLLALQHGEIKYYVGPVCTEAHAVAIWVERAYESGTGMDDQWYWVADMTKKSRTRGPLLKSARAAAEQVISWMVAQEMGR